MIYSSSMVHVLLHNLVKHVLTLFYKREFPKPFIFADNRELRLEAVGLRSK